MDTAPHVVIVRWPEEAGSIEELRALGVPRLLLVAPGAAAPDGSECDEDWIRLPATDDDVRARAAAVTARAARHNHRPEVKGDGRISFRGKWVPLSQTEEALARVLSSRMGDVVDVDTLSEVGSAVGRPMTYGALRIHIMKLRKRLHPLGLAVRTVHGRGYVLEATSEPETPAP